MVSGKSLPTSLFRKGLAPALSSRGDPVAKGLCTQEHAFSGQPASSDGGGRAWPGAISAQHGRCVPQTSPWMSRCFTDLPHSSNVFLPNFASAPYLPQVFVSKKKKKKKPAHSNPPPHLLPEKPAYSSASGSGPRKYISNTGFGSHVPSHRQAMRTQLLIDGHGHPLAQGDSPKGHVGLIRTMGLCEFC